MFPALLVGMMLPIGQTPSNPRPIAPAPSSAMQLLAPNGSASQSQAFAAPGVGDNPPPAAPATPNQSGKSNDKSESKDKDADKDKDKDKEKDKEKAPEEPAGFVKRFFRGYETLRVWFPNWLGKPEEKKDDDSSEPAPFRRALPAPLPSPPFPSGEWQGYPLIGVPAAPGSYPLMNAIYGLPNGDAIKDSRIQFYGWINPSGNWSNAKNTNTPDSYWIVPNSVQLDQIVFRLERQVDSAQQDHIDIGFRSSLLYGTDYRYMTAGGWFSDQLLKHNYLYGVDPTEQYIDIYVPGVAQGMIIRVGRWIACPDIETQFAPDNYMGSHSLLFTYDTYTQSGIMLTFCVNNNWMFQVGLTAGTDMAPWYPGATPTGFLGLRWVSNDNRDSLYTCLNNINTAKFRTFEEYGELVGHDNFNYIVSTWTHKFTESGSIHTNTEAYYMWQFDAHVGGSSSVAPVDQFGGGGLGAPIPGDAAAYGVLNYTEFQLSKKDYVSVRNEYWIDQKGERTGFANAYSSHSIGLSHNFNDLFQIRPEVGYYRGYWQPAFDDGQKMGEWIIGFDSTIRF
jgi:hypothetical protein